MTKGASNFFPAIGSKFNTCHDANGQFCSGSGGGFGAAVDASLVEYQRRMREQFGKPSQVEGGIVTSGVNTSMDIEKAKTDITKVIREVDDSGQIIKSSNMVQLSGSDKFAMLGVSIEQNGSIVLRQIYMRDNAKRGGPQGPASRLYRSLGKVAEGYGDGKLHVYSPGEYTAQRKFWDQVPNAVIE